jgi:hypothetical protein
MRVVGTVPADLVESLAVLARARTLEDVLGWAHANGGSIVDVIVQDEFTHDVIVRGPAPAYVCFDTT